MTIDEKRKTIIRNIVARLKDNGEASNHIRNILKDEKFRIWLDTWVVFPLEQAAADLPKDDYLAKKNFEAGLSMSS